MQEEPKTSFLINFIVRAVVGMGLIFFVNQYLEYRGISLRVGLNGISFFDIRNPWSARGCDALRDIGVQNFIEVAQK